MQRIYISGSIGYDEIMNFPNHFKDYFHPEKLHQINVSFAVDSLAKHLGGCSTNISYSLRLTIDYMKDTRPIISPVGAVGKDGEQLIEFFKSNNIDISYILQDKKLYTATGKVITDQNDNQIWGFYYGASALDIKFLISNFKFLNKKKDYSNNKEFWVLSATHERPFTTALRHVIKNKLPYLFDPGMTLTWIRDDLLKKGVLNATYLIGNDYEIAMIEKRLKMTVAQMVEKGVNVIVTLGDKGVRYFGVADSVSRFQSRQYSPSDKGIRAVGSPSSTATCSSITVRSVKLKKVVDPTGAGDAWRGGFVGALISGKKIKECLVMGNVMASFAVETMGTVEYVAKREEIEKRVKSISK